MALIFVAIFDKFYFELQGVICSVLDDGRALTAQKVAPSSGAGQYLLAYTPSCGQPEHP